MLLFVVGKRSNSNGSNDYIVLDIDKISNINTVSKEELYRLVVAGKVANVGLFGKELRGRRMSLLKDIKSVDSNRPWRIVLYSVTHNDGRLEYVTCTNKGEDVACWGVNKIKNNLDLFCNVSRYWTNREDREIVASTGSVFETYASLLNRCTKIQENLNKNKNIGGHYK